MMKTVQIINQTKDTLLGSNVLVANNFITRGLGLLLKNQLQEGEGLIMIPCNSIHSFFMKFPFDAIFLNDNFFVIHLISKMRPFQVSPLGIKSKYVIEVQAGTILRTNTEIADQIDIEGL